MFWLQEGELKVSTAVFGSGKFTAALLHSKLHLASGVPLGECSQVA